MGKIKFQAKKGWWGEKGWVDVGFLKFIKLWLGNYVVRIFMEKHHKGD